MMTTPSQFYEKLAEKHNVSIDTVRQVLYFFYRVGVIEHLNKLTSHEIYVSKLGSFKIKAYKLHYVLDKLENDLKTGRWSNEEKVAYFTKFFEDLKRIDNSLKEIKQQEKQFNELYKQDSRDISEQKQDMGRLTE